MAIRVSLIFAGNIHLSKMLLSTCLFYFPGADFLSAGAPVASKPLKRAVRFFTHTLASIGFPTTTAAVSKPKSCSNVACSRQPHPSGRDCQRYLFPSSPSMYQSYAAHGHQRHSHHPYHRISRNSKSEAVAATTAVGFSRYHRNRRGGGAVWCTWRDSRVYSSHRLAKTIELEPTGIIKGFPKSSSSSGSMSSASSQQQKPAQETYPSSLLANSSPEARCHNTRIDEGSQWISRASQVFGWLQATVWNRHGIHLNTKLKIYKAVVLTTILYGAKTWTVYSNQAEN
ncbi:unnamed protein product [Schistocephalus solidus]|uniref:Uncharacterized protein n=1 Tax=Schistocephalus solidus TaxID=70667 RepID=A0A183TFV1_SCHSO|nr:unnamed protein product [Schistocephalus solidus]